MLSALSEEERERFWLMLRQVADAAELCPRTPVEDAAACAGEEPPGS